ncbi:MAG: glycine--tRNA ligase subunit beta [Deltaproteobacteria bacterium]|nr:glycine--tRNA ligase subunit beta [Deltaproteobacteria bacterium]
MPELFIEVGTEEMPARFVGPAVDGLAANLAKLLGGLASSPARKWATPRRFAVAFDHVAARAPRTEKLVTGPALSVAFRDGVATPAGVAFAAKFGLAPEQLERVQGPKGEVIAARSVEGGQALEEIVAGGLEAAILGIPFKKTMRWGSRREAFARPIRHVCAVLDGERVDAAVCGLRTVDDSDGHWLLSPGRFRVRSADGWVADSRAARVLVDIVERRDTIITGLHAEAARLRVDLRIDEDLLAEVVNLVEAPRVLAGAFDDSLLDLPPRLLVESMKVNQRYFPTYRDGALTQHFLFASNNPDGHAALIAEGNARVLAARFADAKFFFEEDRKKPLAEHGQRLAGMIWIRGLGSMAERQVAVATAAERLAPTVGADPASTLAAGRLCKCDLATQMVGEFPELQGHVGHLLAAREGVAAAVAIEEHYHPRFTGDTLPTSAAGLALALAERLTLLDRTFAAGLQPKGGADPLGLRRAANGVVALLPGAGCSLPELSRAAGLEPRDDVVDFVLARQRASLQEEGVPTDVVDAAMGASLLPGDLLGMAERARALGALVRDGRFGAVRATFRRVAGLVKQNPGDAPALESLDESRLGDAGRALSSAVHLASHDGGVSRQLEALLALRPLVDTYFDSMMVMADDPADRAARLGLLRVLVARFASLADFSRLATE